MACKLVWINEKWKVVKKPREDRAGQKQRKVPLQLTWLSSVQSKRREQVTSVQSFLWFKLFREGETKVKGANTETHRGKNKGKEKGSKHKVKDRPIWLFLVKTRTWSTKQEDIFCIRRMKGSKNSNWVLCQQWEFSVRNWALFALDWCSFPGVCGVRQRQGLTCTRL